MILLLGFFALGAVPDTVPTPVPPPVPQSVADCTAPTYASDFTVCSSSELLALDRELAALLPLPRVADVEVEGQEAWFRRSRMCASRGDQADCLRAAYAERLSIARALRGNAIKAPALVPTRCRKASLSVADLGDGVFLVQQGERRWLALAMSDTATWQPHAANMTKGRRLEVRSPDGKTIRCEAVPGKAG